jgi:hypothetical protein
MTRQTSTIAGRDGPAGAAAPLDRERPSVMAQRYGGRTKRRRPGLKLAHRRLELTELGRHFSSASQASREPPPTRLNWCHVRCEG